MRRLSLLVTGSVFLLLVGLGSWPESTYAEPTAPLLTGEIWQQMAHDNKLAFIWGMGNLLELEGALKEPLPSGRKSFLPVLTQGLRGQPMNAVVQQIDAYYQAHPQQLQQPVVEVLLRAVALPTVQATQRGGKGQ